jgi:YfiR/HmsC-like
MLMSFRALVAAAFIGACAALAPAESLREYQAKGAFLVNFARFIDWPPDTFDGSAGQLLVCFAGERWIEGELETAIAGRQAGNRTLRLTRPSSPTGCHLLFVTATEPIDSTLRLASDFTVVVGEHRDFLKAGGHIQLHMDADHIRFDIAPSVVKSSRFQVSSRLLILARPPRKSP